MPRPNPPRKLFAEPHVAARIAIEREARSWSYEGLAKRLTDAGCPIQASAIYKIEKADPPRRITVDELVAFAAVFDVAVEELLVDPAMRLPVELAQLLERFETYQRHRAANFTEAARLEQEGTAIVDRVQELVGRRADGLEVLAQQLQERYPDEPLFQEAFMQEVRRGQKEQSA